MNKGLLERGKLILVSNREPYIHEKTKKGIKCKKAVGGLVSALDPAMQSSDGIWVAWGSGSADLMVCDSKGRVEVPCENPNYMLKRVMLSKRETSNYYYGFSNRVLWPISHLFVEKARFKPEYWRTYKKVNAKFAKAVLEEASPRDMIWVHDYHLSLVPRLLGGVDSDAKTAFFWHIPFPPWEVFRTLLWRREILDGLLGSDLIGFHTQPYVKNFMECVEKGLGASVDEQIVKLSDHETVVKAFPIGIDYEWFVSHSSSKRIAKRARRLRRGFRAKHIILSVDRLDYTKGILSRLLAYERFLEKYPNFQEKVTFVQIAAPSRTKVEEYRKMKKEIDETLGRISGKFQKADWIPIYYFYRSIPHEQLVAYYRCADIALVTPLIDGMNLVAKEYIAAREEGVLILSEFAGATEKLEEAVPVNPYDIEKIVKAIKTALEMPLSEKKRRFDALRMKVKRRNIYWWLEKILSEWQRIYKQEEAR